MAPAFESRPTTEARDGFEGTPDAVPCKLVVLHGPDAGREVPLERTVRVGSGRDNDLVLSDPHISRMHVTFTVDAGRIAVRDLDSKNGTMLAGARVVDAHVLVGTVIQLGPSTVVAVQPRWYVREVPPSRKTSFGELRGESFAMRELFAIFERVAPTDVPVLLEGETGTGKELAARSLHAASKRAKGPFVAFDCSAVARDLAESELFGHRRGAFSGAVADRAGAFEQADGGTLFLDEIGELSLELQPKLLRALETSEVRAVGADAARRVDVRVIAATNRDLHAEAARGTFRSDLVYRLDVVRVRMPPLRNRPEDIPVLVRHLLEGRIADTDAVSGPNLSRLAGYAWPGNVRELRNQLFRAVALASKGDEPPRFGDLVLNVGAETQAPLTIGQSFPGVDAPMLYKDAKDELISQFERAYVEALMRRHQGNVTHAAAAAGLSRKHLYELLRRTDWQPDGA